MIAIRRASAEDLDHFGKGWPTAAAVVGLVDGERAGIGGVAFAGGRAVAFCDLTPAARRYPVAIHRAARKFLSEMKAGGRRLIFAAADPRERNAAGWLAALGFTEDHNGIWIWRA